VLKVRARSERARHDRAVVDIYRDPKEGALARRSDLVRARRDELALLPHAVRRVVVARRARTAASIAAILSAGVVLAGACVPDLAAVFARVMPGPWPAPLSTVLFASWLVALGAYVYARATAEHRFAVAMSRCVLPSDDLDHDVERFSHEGPDRVARTMAHRLEVRSASLPVLAAAILVPATIGYVLLAVRAQGWPETRAFEMLLARSGTMLASIGLGGLAAAILVSRPLLRRPGMAPIALAIALVAGIFAVCATSWALLGVTVIAATIGVLTLRLRRERDQIEAEDPADGSELWSLAGFVRRLCAAAVRTCRRITARHLAWTFAAWALATVGYLGYRWTERAPSAPAADSIHRVVPGTLVEEGRIQDDREPQLAVKPHAPRFQAHRDNEGALEIVVDQSRERVSLAEAFGIDTIPKGWHASLHVVALAGRADVYAFGRDRTVAAPPTERLTDQSEVFEMCADHNAPFILDAVSATGPATLRVTMTLSLANCP
jgi:hypothetical protein